MKRITSLLLSLMMVVSITSGLDFSAYAEETEHVHDLAFSEQIAPTCTKVGYDLYSCTGCDYTEKREFTEPTGHAFSFGECKVCGETNSENVPPQETVVLDEQSVLYIKPGQYGYFYFTPEEDGFYNIHIVSEPKISSYINETDGSDEDLDFLGTDTEGDYVRQLTAGISYTVKLNVNTFYSGNRSAIIALTITNHTHSYSEEITEATCNVEGEIVYTCDICAYSYTEVLPPDASKHKFVVNGICSVCGAEDEKYTKSVHNVNIGETSSVIVKTSGETESFSFTAEEENFYFIELKSKAGNYNLKVFDEDGNRIVNANISSSNYNCRISAGAGEKYNFEVTKNNTDNYDVTVTKHQHTMNSTVVKAGCDSLGYTYHSCNATYCEYEYKDNYVPATGKHNFKTKVIAPTCVEPGYTEYSCTNCDAGYLYNYTSPSKSKHNFVEGFCTECGTISSNITVSPLTLSVRTTITTSNNKPSVVSFKPKTSGWYTFCSYSGTKDTYGTLLDSDYNVLEDDDDGGSGYNYSIDYILTAGKTYYLVTEVFDSTSSVSFAVMVSPHVHKYLSVKQAATCGEKGFTMYYCNCGAAYFDKITPATNKHKWVVDEKVPATCIDDGYTIEYCSLCSEERTTYTSKANGLHKYKNNVCIYCEDRIHNTEIKEIRDIAVGETVNVSFDKANQITYLNFTPDTSGYYMFQSFGIYDTYVTMNNQYGYPLVEDDNSALANNCRIVTYFDAGFTYQFRVEVTDFDSGNYDVSIVAHTHDYAELIIPAGCGTEGVTIYTCKDCNSVYDTNYVMPTYKHTFKEGTCTQCGEFDDNYKVPELKPGQAKTVNQYEDGYFIFTPDYSGEYKLYATGKYATMAMVVTVFGDVVALDAANNDSDFNFNMTLNLSAGVTYYIFTSTATVDSYNVVLDYNHTHSYKTSSKTTKATKSANGKIVTTYTCKICGYSYSKTTKTIYKPTTYTLSTSTYTYNGSAKKPSVTVKDSKGNKLKSGTDYTVSYPSGRKNVGKYTIKITFKGNYSGTATKTFTIKPKNTSLSSVSAGSKKFTVKWKKYTTQTTGYQIQYSTDKNFKKNNKTVTVSSNKTTSKTISKLSGKKKYYVRIRTYKTVSGTKYYSSWSSSKSVTTKK